jgi:hypothetical protein
MPSKNWIALGVVGFVAAACGGGVSLGTVGGDAGPGTVEADASGGGDSAVECTANTDCGPVPQSAALTCLDGSRGGNTGRCLKTATGCAWEIRACPPGTCLNPDGTLDPNLTTCTSAADCAVVDAPRDCCGSQRAAGVTASRQASVRELHHHLRRHGAEVQLPGEGEGRGR